MLADGEKGNSIKRFASNQHVRPRRIWTRGKTKRKRRRKASEPD